MTIRMTRLFSLFLFSFSGLNSASHAHNPLRLEGTDTFDTLNREKAAMVFLEIMDRIIEKHVDKVDIKKLVQGALDGMLSRVDSHSGYFDPEEFQKLCEHTKGEFGGLGMEVTSENNLIKIISPIDDTPAAKGGLKAGDLIVAIDNTPVSGLTLYEAVNRMRGKPGTSVKLLIKRDGEKNPLTFDLLRQIIAIQSVKWRAEGDVGYIRVSTFDEKTTELMEKAVTDLKKTLGSKLNGYVIDIRDNPGGLLDQAISVVNLFIDKGVIVSTKGRRPEHSSVASAIPGNAIIKDIPVVVLINEGSASASEIMAGALQDHKKALIMGEPSFGKGSVQTLFPLSNGKNGGVKLTIARFYTPLGNPIQGHGIKPDVVVEQLKNATIEKPKVNIREKDLARSLSAEKVETDPKEIPVNEKGLKGKEQPALPNAPAPAGEKKEPNVLESNDKEEVIKDYQLLRAIDTVKALYNFYFQRPQK
jgi:carboxyl-terminal processing protease